MKKAIIISCFNWYETRIKPIREILCNRGFNVKVLIADYNHQNKELIKHRNSECTYIHVPQYKNNLSIQRVHSHLSFGRSVSRVIASYKPHLIYCQIPPNNVAIYCTKYKKKYPDTIYLLDIIDLWPESLPLGMEKNTLPTVIWKKWRDHAIDSADYIFTECDLYRKKLKLNRKKSDTLYLFKNQSEEERRLVDWIIMNKRSEKNTIKLAYLGTMNYILDIDGIVNVIKEMKKRGFECELYAIGDGENKEKFRMAVEAAGCKANFYGVIYDEMEKIRILAHCDYAFNMMKSDVSVGLTTKSIDYLSYGLPLINNIKGDTWKLIEQYGMGINIGEKVHISRVVDRSNVIKIYREKFTEYSFRTEVENVFAAIDL